MRRWRGRLRRQRPRTSSFLGGVSGRCVVLRSVAPPHPHPPIQPPNHPPAFTVCSRPRGRRAISLSLAFRVRLSSLSLLSLSLSLAPSTLLHLSLSLSPLFNPSLSAFSSPLPSLPHSLTCAHARRQADQASSRTDSPKGGRPGAGPARQPPPRGVEVILVPVGDDRPEARCVGRAPLPRAGRVNPLALVQRRSASVAARQADQL